MDFSFLKINQFYQLTKLPSVCFVQQRTATKAGYQVNLAITWKKKHAEHKNKSEQFFKDYYNKNFIKPGIVFQKTLKSYSKSIPAVLSSIDAAYYILQNKKPYTDAEGFKPLFCKWVERFFGIDAAKQIDTNPLSARTFARRCTLVAKNMKEQLLEKLRLCKQFSIQLDESADVSGEAQLLVYCRFPIPAPIKCLNTCFFVNL